MFTVAMVKLALLVEILLGLNRLESVKRRFQLIRCSPALVTSKRLTVTRMSERSRQEMSHRVPSRVRSMVRSVPSSTSMRPRSVRVLS